MNRFALVIGAVAVAVVGVGGALVAARKFGTPSATPSASADAPRAPSAIAIAETIYDGKLAPGWEDWGWGPHELPAAGPASVSFEGYGGITFHHAELPSRFGGLVFRYKAPPGWGAFLSVSLKYPRSEPSTFPTVTLLPRDLVDVGDGWREVFVPWNKLNPSSVPFDRVIIAARTRVGRDWVLIDKVALTQPSGALPAPARDANVAVLCGEARRPISPLIYGISQGVVTSGETAHRIGGNPMTRHNWELGTWNTGHDWFFENTKGEGLIWDWIDQAAQRGLSLAAVVPMIGWVAKDATSASFPVSKFGKQEKHDPHRPDVGNGRTPDGKPIKPGPPTETSVPAPPELIRRWIQNARERDRARGKRGIHMYILDNEPSLWNTNHRDVHPEPVGYDELLDRTIRYATVIREEDPEAVIAGPAEWGWSGYMFSAKDADAGFFLKPDRRLHGDVPLVPWYLGKLAEHEKKTGKRLLDVLDVHFYPAAEGIYGGNERTDAEGAALRLRSTRALWDPSYLEESWIKETIRLIPRLKEWVDANYPGLKISLGEWSFGAESHISGGLATAEALGRFGQQGLDAAFYWAQPKEGTATYWAFRAFRNFDGSGGRFLDYSLPTREATNLSVFASTDERRTKVVAVLLNLDPVMAVRARLGLQGCGRVLGRRAFSYAAGSEGLASEPRDDAVETLPPYSLRVVELTLGAEAESPKEKPRR